MQSLEKAAENIIRDAIDTVPQPPADFSRPYDFVRGLTGSAAGASVGALIGSGIGIAAAGTAISGLWPLAAICGAAGLLAGKSGSR